MRTGLLLVLAALVDVVDDDDELPLEPHAATVSAVATSATTPPALA
jgi:hypothetical protein